MTSQSPFVEEVLPFQGRVDNNAMELIHQGSNKLVCGPTPEQRFTSLHRYDALFVKKKLLKV